MLTRRLMLGSAAATPLLWREARADTPRDVAVMAMQIDDIISLDPGESFEFSGNEIGANCYETLVEPDANDTAKILPVLASHWEVAGDGLTYTFYMANGKKFASGNPVTAEDAAWSFGRAVTMDKSPGFILTQFGFTKDNVADRIKPGADNTLVIKVGQAFAPSFLFYCLSANVGGVIDKKVALSHEQNGDLGNGWLKTQTAGSNAWAVRNWKAGESVQMEATPGSAAKLKRLIVRQIAEPSTQLLLLQKGDADIARNFNPEQINAIRGKPEYKLDFKSAGTLFYIAMNQNVPELAHPDVCQAVKWAIDYDAITKNITPDTYEVHQSFIPKGFLGSYDENPFHKDVDKARALMKQAGLENGFSVTLDHQSAPPYNDIAQAIQADLAAIGIKVQLIAAEQRQVITKTRARQHQMAMLRWGSDYLDPNSNAQTFCENPDNGDKSTNRTVAWRSSWQDKDLTGRAEDALKEVDTAKRAAAYIQLQKDFMARAPFAIFLQQVVVAGLRKNITGFELGTLSDGTRYTHLAKT